MNEKDRTRLENSEITESETLEEEPGTRGRITSNVNGFGGNIEKVCAEDHLYNC